MSEKEAKKEKKEKKEGEEKEKKEKKEKKEDGAEKKEKKEKKLKDTGGFELWDSTQGGAAEAAKEFSGSVPKDKRQKEEEVAKQAAKHAAEGKGLMKASDVIKETMGKMNEEKVAKQKEAKVKEEKERKVQAKQDALEAEGVAEGREDFQIMDSGGAGNFMEKHAVTDIMKSTVTEASSSSSSRCQISPSTKRGDPVYIGGKGGFSTLGDFAFVKGFIYIRGKKEEYGCKLKLSRPSVVYVCHSKRPNEDEPWLQSWKKAEMQLPEFDDEKIPEISAAIKKIVKDPNNREVAVPKPPPGVETVIVFVAPDFHSAPFPAEELTEEDALEKKRLDGAAARADRDKASKGTLGDVTVDERMAAVLEKVEKGEKLNAKEKKLHEKHLEKTKVWTNEEDEFAATTNLGAFSLQLPGGKNEPPAAGDAIVCEGFTMSAPKQVLLDNASLTIVQGKRYGILGPNGMGKTTLLRHLAARELPIPLNWDVILVEQEAKASDRTAVEEVLSADEKTAGLVARETALMKQLEEAEGKEGDDFDLEKAQQELSMIAAELDASGAESAEANVRKILCGLGFTNGKPDEDRFSMDCMVVKFSGGWRMRISLAKALFLCPKLLMLDEPTNHLDLDAVLWLDHYLSEQYPHAVIIVSHDADFLDSVVTDILHLEDKQLKHYRGNYNAFRKMHSQKRAELDKEYKKQQDEIKMLKKKGKTKDEAEEQVKRKFGIDSLDNLMEKHKDYLVKFRFIGHGKDQTIGGVNVTEVGFSYNGKEPWLLSDLEIGVDCASRIAIVGPNGAGKSTLLNLMMETLEPCTGEVRMSKGIRVKQYHQHFEELLPLERDPVDYLVNEFNLSPPEKARATLGDFGLPGASHFTKIGNLSGGQKARVAFAALMLMKPHIMILDEPTNHLDIESVEALTEAIKAFNGGLVLVTHDARLITEIDCDIWVVEDGGCYKFEKDFDGYRDKVLDQLEERQLEVERMEKKRREVRAKARAKHVNEKQQEEAKKKFKEAEAKKAEEEETAAKAKAEEEAKAAAVKTAEEAKPEAKKDVEEAKPAAKKDEAKPAAKAGGGGKAALRVELEALKKSALRKRAAEGGASEEALEEADDADDPKEAFIELILASAEDEEAGGAAEGPDLEALRKELEALKKSALRKRAAESGASEEELEEADDADDPKEAFIELIVANEAGAPKDNEAEKKKADAEKKRKAEEEAAEAKKKAAAAEAEAKKKAAEAKKKEAAKKADSDDGEDDDEDNDDEEDEDELLALAMARKAAAKKKPVVESDDDEDDAKDVAKKDVADDFSDDDKKKKIKGKKAQAPKGKAKAKGKAVEGKKPWEESDDDEDNAEESDREVDHAEKDDDKKGKKKPTKAKPAPRPGQAKGAKAAKDEEESDDDGGNKAKAKKKKGKNDEDDEEEPAPKAKAKAKGKKDKNADDEEEEPDTKTKGKKGKAADQDEEEDAPKAKAAKGKKGKDYQPEADEEEEGAEAAPKEESKPAAASGKDRKKAKWGVDGEAKKEKGEEEAAPAPTPKAAAKAAAATEDVAEDGLILSGIVADCDQLRKKGNYLVNITCGAKTVQIIAQRECEVGEKVKVALEGATLENGKTVKREKIAGEWSEGTLV